MMADVRTMAVEEMAIAASRADFWLWASNFRIKCVGRYASGNPATFHVLSALRKKYTEDDGESAHPTP